MAQLTSSPHSSLLLLSILGMAMASSGLPLPRLHPMERITSPSIGQKVSNLAEWTVFYPLFSLHDWSIQTMSEPKFSSSNPKSQVRRIDSWLPVSQPQMEAFSEEDEPSKTKRPDLRPWTGKKEKRNIVVADDAAFRQKSKLLTAMERQNWLNSYMQKLLVVNSQ